MNKFGSGRLVQMFGTAVIVQVLVSGANFFVGFLLIRHTSDVDYGLFVLAQSTITLLVAAQASWLSGPIAVVAPKKPDEARRIMVGAVEVSQRRFLKFDPLHGCAGECGHCTGRIRRVDGTATRIHALGVDDLLAYSGTAARRHGLCCRAGDRRIDRCVRSKTSGAVGGGRGGGRGMAGCTRRPAHIGERPGTASR